MSLFCPACSTYFPSGEVCPRCGQRRPLAHIPAAPDQPLWRAKVPGRVASRLLAARLDDQPVLIVPWAFPPSRTETAPPDGGVSVFDLLNGTLVWEQRLGVPIEGGAALSVEESHTFIVGLAARGIGAGEGWLAALDLRTGEERWRVSVGGAVESTPVVENARVYVTAADGALHCFDARDGQRVWRAPVFDNQPVRLPASPVIVKTSGVAQAILVGTYGRSFGREPGRLVAVDMRGTRQWSVSVEGGQVRGTPLVDSGRAYVTAYRDQPSTGVLMAFETRTGQAVWPQPFVLQSPDRTRGSHNLSAAPIILGSTLLVGSLDHHLYAIDAATGQQRWAHDVKAGIATAPIGLEGLIVCGANDGRVYAVEAATGERAWSFDLAMGAHGLTDPLDVSNFAPGCGVVGADDGTLALLPWHLGQYAWAAARLEQADPQLLSVRVPADARATRAGSKLEEAGEAYALAAHFQPVDAAREDYRQRAERAWQTAGEPEKAAQLWQALDRSERAAAAYRTAGERWRQHDPARAAGYYRLAADLYHRLHEADALNDCTHALAVCLGRSQVRLEKANAGRFIQRAAGKLTLRVINDGPTAIDGLRFWAGGELDSDARFEIPTRFEPGQKWHIPIEITATKERSELDIEVSYAGTLEGAEWHGLLRCAIEAEKPKDQPLQIGDVAHLQVFIAARTEEGVEIRTGDVGLIRSSGGIDTVNVAGDVGAVTARGSDTNIGGDVVGRDKSDWLLAKSVQA